jgi:hypothetical protein
VDTGLPYSSLSVLPGAVAACGGRAEAHQALAGAQRTGWMRDPSTQRTMWIYLTASGISLAVYRVEPEPRALVGTWPDRMDDVIPDILACEEGDFVRVFTF